MWNEPESCSNFPFDPGLEPRRKAWLSISIIGPVRPELLPYLVKLWLQARAFEPETRLVSPLGWISL